MVPPDSDESLGPGEARSVELERQLAASHARTAELEAIVVKQAAQIEVLLEQRRRNSSNSHLPPSSDGPGTAGSTAGKKNAEGKPYEVKDEHGHATYSSKKGDFKLAQNVVPEYLWFNGKVNYTTQDMKIDPAQVVRINDFLGSPDDPKARIWPVKRFHGTQPYGKVHMQLLVPHTATPDDSAFWFNFDWDKALAAGATATGQPYSGQHGFVKTEMLWPITHMVAPGKDAVACASCHSSADKSRLGDLPGVYLPGRDHNRWIDNLGWLAVVGALGGVLVHAFARLLTRRRHAGGH